jgi:hypothetical protein
MGNSSYSFNRAAETSVSFKKMSFGDSFTQVKERKAHDSMLPKNALLRESRDSETHPNSFPIIISLDLTGSMGAIPKFLLDEGLHKIVSSLIQKGLDSPAILFLGIGDTHSDSYPLQVGQFESGDEEMNLWLTRVYPEGGGGGNNGESYNLAWYYAANHTATDAWDKRGQKGILFTIGDEPCLSGLSRTELMELTGLPSQNYTNAQLIEAVREKWDIFHIQVLQGDRGVRSEDFWKALLGQNCISADDYTKIPEIIVNTIFSNLPQIKEVKQNSITEDSKVIL